MKQNFFKKLPPFPSGFPKTTSIDKYKSLSGEAGPGKAVVNIDRGGSDMTFIKHTSLSIRWIAGRLCLCFFYAAVVQLVHAIFSLSVFLNKGDSSEAMWLLNILDVIFFAVLIVPFLIWSVRWCKEYGRRRFVSTILQIVNTYWWLLGIYFVLLYVLLKGFDIGDFSLSHDFLGTQMQLAHTRSSCLLMEYSHQMTETVSSMFFYILMPFFLGLGGTLHAKGRSAAN